LKATLEFSNRLSGTVTKENLKDAYPEILHSGKFSITSMEVDFWGVKSSGGENSHATEVKCSNIPQKRKFYTEKEVK
jgi:hypothetical protein